MMKIIRFWLLATVILITATPAQPQPTRIPRIGYLGGANPSATRAASRHSGRGSVSLGMSRGKTSSLSIDMQEGNPDRLSNLRPNSCVSRSTSSSRLVDRDPFPKEATSTIPIVMTNEGDPVGSGFVASLARPGGNITGLSTLAPELSGKRLELLGEVVPKLSRVAVLGTSTSPAYAPVKRDRTCR